MKKTLTVIGSMLLVVGVFASSSVAHGGKHAGKQGFGSWGGHHHSSKKANVWSAKLTPPGTAAKSRHGRGYGQTGATGATPATGPAGKVLYAQSHKKYLLAVKLANLKPTTEYSVTITKTSVDPTGPTGATIAHRWHDETTPPTGATSTPPTIGPITTDANGNGKALVKGLRSAAGLEKRATHSVEVKDPSGAIVLAGDLTRNGFRHHRGNCGGDRNPLGSESRSKHHH